MKHKGLQKTTWPTGKNRWRGAECVSIKKEKKHHPVAQCKGAYQKIIQSSAYQSIQWPRSLGFEVMFTALKSTRHLFTTLDTKEQGHPSGSFQFLYPSFLQFSYPCLVTVLPPAEISKFTNLDIRALIAKTLQEERNIQKLLLLHSRKNHCWWLKIPGTKRLACNCRNWDLIIISSISVFYLV